MITVATSHPQLSTICVTGRLNSCLFYVVCCRKWIDKGKAIDVRDHTQRTPLHYAAQWGQEYILEYLIHCGADVNAQDFIMDTPLHFVSFTSPLTAPIKLVKHLLPCSTVQSYVCKL